MFLWSSLISFGGSFASPSYCNDNLLLLIEKQRQCTNALFPSCLFYAQSMQVGTARVCGTLKLRAHGLPYTLLDYMIFLNSNPIAYLTEISWRVADHWFFYEKDPTMPSQEKLENQYTMHPTVTALIDPTVNALIGTLPPYSIFLTSSYLKFYWQPCRHCLHQSYQFHVEGRFSQPFGTKDIRHRNATKGSFCLIFWIRKSLVGQDKESFPVIFKNQMASSLGSLWQHSKK